METCGEARYAASKPAPVRTHTCHAHETQCMCVDGFCEHAKKTKKKGRAAGARARDCIPHMVLQCKLHGEHAPPPMCASGRSSTRCLMLWTLATAYLIIDAHCACTLQEVICTASTEHTFQLAFAVAASVLALLGARCTLVQRMRTQIISVMLQAALAFAQSVNVLRAQAIRHLGHLQQVIHDGLAWVRTESLQDGNSCAHFCIRFVKACVTCLQTGALWAPQASAVARIVRALVGPAAAALQCTVAIPLQARQLQVPISCRISAGP